MDWSCSGRSRSGAGPYSTSNKKVDTNIKEIANKTNNDLCGIKELDSGLAKPSQSDLVSGKLVMQADPLLQREGYAYVEKSEAAKMAHEGKGSAKVNKCSSTLALECSENKYFTTKLSLPKLISVSKTLTKPQIKIVEGLGFHHLLDLSCSKIRKPLVLFLVKHFDVSTRSLVLPSGYTITLSPLQVHQILGIPIGGLSLPRTCDDNINKLTSAYIKCSGKYPTINELKNLLSENLEGDQFKMVFTLFVVSCFLCPSSNDCCSPEFCSLVLKSDQIGLFDWAGIVLDKLVDGIEKFQQSKTMCGVSTLSGCVFVLMIIYFEFLDISDYHLPSSVPRIKFWTTETVRKFADLDCINEEQALYGKKPMKDISLTAFSKVNLTEGSFIDTELDVGKMLKCVLPGEEFSNVRLQLEGTYAEMWTNFVKVARPSLIDQILKTAEIIKANHSSSNRDRIVHESSNLLKSSDKVVPQSSSVNHQSNKSVELLDFEPLCLPETNPMFEKIRSSGDIFHMAVKSLSEINLEATDDIAQVAEPFSQALLLSVLSNEYLEAEGSYCPQSLAELTMSALDLEPSTSRPFVLEPKENILNLGSSFAAEPPDFMPLKKRPVCNDLQIDETKGGSFDHPLIGTEAKKLRFDNDGSTPQADVPKYDPHLGIFRRDHVVKSVASQFDCHDDIFDEETVRMLDEHASQFQNMRSIQSSKMEMPKVTSVPAEMEMPFVQATSVPAKSALIKDVESVSEIENMRSMQSRTIGKSFVQATSVPGQVSLISSTLELQGCTVPSKISCFKHAFTSSVVEQAVHQHIVSNIPGPHPARSPKIIKISKMNWVDHRTFGLSMQVYGSISPYVMNIMGVAIMEEQFRKDFTDCLPCTTWCKHILPNSFSVQLQDPNLVPTDISHLLLERCIGFRLDNADLVFVPACKNRYWYVVIANFRDQRFEVVCPFKDLDVIREDALLIISSFRQVFKCAYPVARRFDIYRMRYVFASVSNSINQNDTGVFVLEILKSYDGHTHLFFKEQHAKPIREALTYYLCTHEDNLILLPAVRDICQQHGINLMDRPTHSASI